MTKVDDKIIELLKKVNALAKRGVDGEKESAAQRLEYLMGKYGVTFDMLEADTKKEREFVVLQDQNKFFNQIVYSVCGGVDIFYYEKDKYKKKIRKLVTMTEVEFIEVSERFAFFWKKYEEEMKLFYVAFIRKNELTSKPSEDRDERKEPTPEEIEEYLRVRQMMGGIKKYNLQKQLENK